MIIIKYLVKKFLLTAEIEVWIVCSFILKLYVRLLCSENDSELDKARNYRARCGSPTLVGLHVSEKCTQILKVSTFPSALHLARHVGVPVRHASTRHAGCALVTPKRDQHLYLRVPGSLFTSVSCMDRGSTHSRIQTYRQHCLVLN